MVVNQPEKGTFQFQMWDKAQLQLLHEASLSILSKTGMSVHSEEAIELLRNAGAQVDGKIVKIPANLVENALKTAPSVFTLYSTDGSFSLELEKNSVYYGTGTDMPEFLDQYTHTVRPAVLKDCENSTKVAHSCANIDWIAPMALANDVHPHIADLHHFKAMRQFSNKPNLTLATDAFSLKGMIDMAALQAGGYKPLMEKPTLLHYAEPISPLVNPEESLEKLLMCAEYGIPVTYCSGIMAGATGPVTLAGAIAVGNAECLAGLVIHQLKAKGAPFMYGIAISIMDMKTTISPYGGPEQALMHTIIGELGRFYGLPSFGISGCTDSNDFDLQMGAEYMYSSMCAALGGTNFVHDNGYMGAGQMGSLQSILAADEIIGLIKRFARGVDLTPESLALELIDEVGPGGQYLQSMHTLKNFRKEHWIPEFFNRKRYTAWSQDGALSIPDKLKSKALSITEQETAEFLTAEQLEGFNKIIGTHTSKLGL
ncbi:MAG: trimethylamine methyltransferase family protein [Eubacteriales bacterium]